MKQNLLFLSTLLFTFLCYSQVANQPGDLVVCDDNQNDVSQFNLTAVEAEVLSGQSPSEFTVSYYVSPADAASGNNPITNPTSFTNYINPQEVFVRVEENSSANYDTTVFNIQVSPAPDLNQDLALEVCGDPQQGEYVPILDLEYYYNIVYGNSNNNTYSYTYYESQADADAFTNPINPNNYTYNQIDTLYVSAINNNTDCTSNVSFDLYFVGPYIDYTSPLELCSTNETETFNLELNRAQNDSFGNFVITYHLTESDAYNNTNELPLEYQNISNPQTIYIRLAYPNTYFNECFKIEPLDLIINNGTSVTANTIEDQQACSTNLDYDLTIHEAAITGGQTGTTISYYTNANDLVQSFNPIQNPNAVTLNGNNTFYIRVDADASNCYNSTQLNITVQQTQDLNTATLFNCNSSEFDLQLAINQITNSYDGNITLHETEADALSNSNAISNINNYTVTSNSQTLYSSALVTAQCYGIGVVELIIDDDLAISNLSTLYACDDDNDGFTSFDLTSKTLEVLGAKSLNNYSVLYYETNADAQNDVNPIAYSNINNSLNTPYANIIQNLQTIHVRLESNTTDCFALNTLQIEVLTAPILTVPTPLEACDEGGNGIIEFNLDSKISEMLNGLADVTITFYATTDDASNGFNSISSPYTTPGTVYARGTNGYGCFNVVPLDLIVVDCPITVNCGTTVNSTYCYVNDDTTQFSFVSNSGEQLQVVFNSGSVEFNYDGLVVLDSDGVTDLNAGTPYGNNGNVTGLSYVASGDNITVFVNSDDIFSCSDQSYAPLDFDVLCIDSTVLPNCDNVLINPSNGATDVNNNLALNWSSASGFPTGYRLSMGTSSGNTDLFNAFDVGNVTTYNLGQLQYATIYYVTITPYNSNGDATGCIEESFTTMADPSILVDCNAASINTTYCYTDDDTTEYIFVSSNGGALTVVFNSGEVEDDYDPLVVLDSDGVTNLNAATPYGNAGDVSGLTFVSTGDRITITVQSDDSYNCGDEGYSPLDFNVFCQNNIGFIHVNTFLDENNDGIFNGNDTPFNNGQSTYEINNDGSITTVNSNTGGYLISNYDENNAYDITFETNAGYENCYTIPTALYENVTVLNGETVTINFPVAEQMPCGDLAVYLIPFSAPRPGFDYSNHLKIKNLGSSTIASGSVTFIHDDVVNYVSSSANGASVTITPNATGATVDFTNLLPGEIRTVWFFLNTPASVSLGEYLTNTVTSTSNIGDIDNSNNTSTLTQLVVGSYDPNDITESHGRDIIYNDFVNTSEYLFYTIRFQNVGTAEAINVRIENTVSALLDLSTIQMLNSSHNYVMTQNSNQLTWTFDNINLPSQAQDNFGSNGYVYFKIKPTTGYTVGTVIPNTADIYFDFNAPVITNTYETEFIMENLSVEEFASNDFIIYPNPATSLVNIKLKNALDGNTSVEIIDVQGKVIIQNVLSDALEINVKNLEAGLYFVKLKNNNKQMIKKLIIE